MDIVFMHGGLGNQVFQYIFARYLEETKKVRVYIDDMYFHLLRDEINRNINTKPDITVDRLTHNGYEMDYVFPNMTKPLLLSEHIDNNVWQHMVNTAKKSSLPQLSVARQLLENGYNLSVLIEAADCAALAGLDCPIFSTPGNQYNTSVAELVDNTYYYGYWINPGWFNRYKHILLKDLSFRPVSDPHNKRKFRLPWIFTARREP